MHGREEVGVGNRPPLAMGDRHQRHLAKAEIERLEVGTVLPAVQGRHRPIGHLAKQWEMQLVDMEMQNIKFFRKLAYLVEHQHIIGEWIADIAVEAQRRGRAAHELGRGDGVRARKQGHLVAEADELIGEIGNDSLGSAIKPRRHTLHQRRDLRNFHVFLLQRGPVMART
jgi:hypothetical protein